jgi:ribonuclease VapC
MVFESIVVDTSAIICLLLEEGHKRQIADAIYGAEIILISAGTLSELFIVAQSKGVLNQARKFVEELQLQVIPVTKSTADQIEKTYNRWGKGFNSASLNFGDCFAYALAKSRGFPLLYIGNDFKKTDILSVI